MAEIKIEESLQPNSRKFKEEQKKQAERQKLDPVISNKVVSTKKTLSQKFSDLFIKDDFQDVKDYVIFDVIIPGIKDTLLDMIEMMFFGNRGGRRSSRRYYGQQPEKTSYSAQYKRASYTSQREERPRREVRSGGYSTGNIDYRSIVVASRVDAEEVVAHMRSRIREYGMVSVAELFDLINEPSNNYNDNNWGWTEENDISWRRYGGGYLIVVREAVYLD